MNKTEFKAHVQSKITELESMPSHGDEYDDSVFDESEFLDYSADIVRDAYVQAAAFGFIQEPPAKLMDRDEALYHLRQVLAFLGGKEAVKQKVPCTGPYTVKQAASMLGISTRKIYQLCNDGKLGCERHGKAIRITDEHIATYRSESERQPIKTSGFKHLD